MCPLIGVVLAGCGEPISNAWFFTGDEITAALPSGSRLTPPVAFLSAGDVPDPVFASAIRTAVDLDDVLVIPASAGEVLASTTPDTLSDDERIWDPLVMAFSDEGSVVTAWIAGSVVSPVNGNPQWTMQGASSSSGAFTTLGSGHHEPEAAQGSFEWSVSLASLLLGRDTEGTIAVDYTDEPRRVVVEGLGLEPAAFTDHEITWSDNLELTEDSLQWPVYATAWHVETEGGGASGVVTTDATTLAFTSCWDAAGNTVYLGGDEGVLQLGAASACGHP